MSKKIHENCIICGSADLLPLERYNKMYLWQCLECDQVFSVRIPTEDEIARLQTPFKKKDRITSNSLRRYSSILDRFEKFRQTNCVLDVDCTHGEFMALAKDFAWDVYGTADTEQAIASCESKGLKMHLGSYDFTHYPDEYFDIICLRNVLEMHLNPLEIIEQAKRTLRKGGVIYVTTPNFNALLRYRLGERYILFNYPLRLTYYTKKTLRKVFKMQGFKVFETETTGIPLSARKFAGATQNVPQTEESQDKIINHKESWFMRSRSMAVNSVLSFFGLGNFIKGWFVKQ